MNGKFNAKIKDYTTSESSNGNVQIAIQFNVEVDGGEKTMSWYGYLTEKAKKQTLITLINCGLESRNFNQLHKLIDGVQSGLLDTNKAMSLEIQQEPSSNSDGSPKFDDNGNAIMRDVIRWVNDPARAPKIEKLDAGKNSQFFQSQGFGNDLQAILADMGGDKNTGSMPNNGQGMNNQNNGYNNQGQNNQGYNNNQGQNYNNQNNGYNGQNNSQNNNQGYNNAPAHTDNDQRPF